MILEGNTNWVLARIKRCAASRSGYEIRGHPGIAPEPKRISEISDPNVHFRTITIDKGTCGALN
jgi:hypothetical protein